MAETKDPLVLYGHRIVPVVKHEGSVRRWRCLNCSEEATDAEFYLDRACAIDG